jgi:hypothetical protein
MMGERAHAICRGDVLTPDKCEAYRENWRRLAAGEAVSSRQLPPGPGTHLAAILRELGIPKTAGCGCDEMLAKMNQWGPDGCGAHRAEILTHLQSAYAHATLATKATALGAALWHGYPLTLSGILDLAIDRSRLATTAGDKP